MVTVDRVLPAGYIPVQFPGRAEPDSGRSTERCTAPWEGTALADQRPRGTGFRHAEVSQAHHLGGSTPCLAAPRRRKDTEKQSPKCSLCRGSARASRTPPSHGRHYRGADTTPTRLGRTRSEAAYT